MPEGQIFAQNCEPANWFCIFLASWLLISAILNGWFRKISVYIILPLDAQGILFSCWVISVNSQHGDKCIFRSGCADCLSNHFSTIIISKQQREHPVWNLYSPNCSQHVKLSYQGGQDHIYSKIKPTYKATALPTWDNLTTSLCSSSLPIPALGNKILQAPGPLKHGQMILQDCFDLTAGPGDQPTVLKVCAHQVL